MHIWCLLFTVLLSPDSWSESIDIILNDTLAQKEYLFALEQDDPLEDAAALHQELLLSSTLAKIPSRLDFKIMNSSIDGHVVTRTLPIIDGIEVEGADGILAPGSQKSFNYTYFDMPKTGFILNAAEALERALSFSRASTLKNPYVEKIQGSYEPVWLMHFGELRPAYKTRPPTLSIFDLQDIYVDAVTGEILKMEASAQFVDAPAQVFVYSPAPEQLDRRDLRSVILKNLSSLEEDAFLKGQYVSVHNCCHYFTCPDEGPCTEANRRCALESHRAAQQSRELIQLPTDSLGLDPLLSLPKTISVEAVRCTYLPFAKASLKSQNSTVLGFFETPIDEPGVASEMDKFSEVQAYYSVMTFFNHMRFLMADNTWCLREHAMSCNADGSPVLDEQGLPKNPYRVFVNQMIPDMMMDGRFDSNPNNFLGQILAGKGTPDNPVVLDGLARIGNAAFVPALSTIKATTPRADEILSDLIKPYDHNVFFQGARDFAYDGDVVFHEFMHAVTTSLVNKLNTLGLNEWGIHSEPGSLNEGWSDYFAAAFSQKPTIGSYAAIKDGYGEASLRSIDNNLRCPEDVIGEIHQDGLVWSGALWEIRQDITKSLGPNAGIEFDRAVLTALAQAKTTEDFKTQSEKLLTSINDRATLGPNVAKQARAILDKRGVSNCFRAFALSRVDNKNHLSTTIKKTLMVPSKNQIGIKNYAPSSSQLAIAIPAGAKSLSVSWRQYLGGTGALLGTETTPDKANNIIPLGIISSFDEPIKWRFLNKSASPTRQDGPITDEPAEAFFRDGRWEYSRSLQLDRCEQRVLYLSLLSNDFKYILEDIKVNFDVDIRTERSDCNFSLAPVSVASPTASGCTSGGTPGFGALVILLGMAISWARRRAANSNQSSL